ncbi:MAG: hypothetical protein O7G85_00080 [Planctomycetota bacterium]|nr:hypothetical protein [Planctomycetota bacterium]
MSSHSHQPKRRESNHADSSSVHRETTTLLLEFVHDRDVQCPKCGYNIRNLTNPICPECQEDLELTVGLVKVRFEWLIVTLIPSAFSGICALILLVPILVALKTNAGLIPTGVIVLDSFGWLSGGIGIGLFLKRRQFMRLDSSNQFLAALFTWVMHLGAFGILVLFLI